MMSRRDGGVWLDVTHLRKEVIQDRLPTMYQQFLELDGIDISKEKMEVAPTAHYSMGGVVADMKCTTKIKGLFAVGEVISQIHGANRLGGNSLLDTSGNMMHKCMCTGFLRCGLRALLGTVKLSGHLNLV